VLITTGAAVGFGLLYKHVIAPKPPEGLEASDLRFAETVPGNTVQDVISLLNTGDSELRIESFDLKGKAFSVATAPDLPRQLRPGERFALPVVFAPDSDGRHKGELRVLSSRSGAEKPRMFKVRFSARAREANGDISLTEHEEESNEQRAIASR
jgi:hypothetical protein